MADSTQQTLTSELITVGEAAAVLRLRVSTIRAWVLHRRINFVKLGRRVLIRRSDVDALVRASLVPAKPAYADRVARGAD